MNLNKIDTKKTGVLFFDLLNGYYHEASESAKLRKTPMVENAALLMRGARTAGLPIFFAYGNHRPDFSTSTLTLTDTNNALEPWPNGIVCKMRLPAVAGESSSQVIPELEPNPDDYYIPKYRWSAFHQTYLDLALRSGGIDTMIISGGSTEVGVASTIYAGRDLDYNLIIVRDACGSGHADHVNDIFMEYVFPRMGRVRTTAEVLQMIQESQQL
jgi:ureidoacrylate peracid hydrolase